MKSERDVRRILGPPDRVVGRRERLRCRVWICSTCHTLTETLDPQPIPAPCASISVRMIGVRV
jgi:hypothetical protein